MLAKLNLASCLQSKQSYTADIHSELYSYLLAPDSPFRKTLLEESVRRDVITNSSLGTLSELDDGEMMEIVLAASPDLLRAFFNNYTSLHILIDALTDDWSAVVTPLWLTAGAEIFARVAAKLHAQHKLRQNVITAVRLGFATFRLDDDESGVAGPRMYIVADAAPTRSSILFQTPISGNTVCRSIAGVYSVTRGVTLWQSDDVRLTTATITHMLETRLSAAYKVYSDIIRGCGGTTNQLVAILLKTQLPLDAVLSIVACLLTPPMYARVLQHLTSRRPPSKKRSRDYCAPSTLLIHRRKILHVDR